MYGHQAGKGLQKIVYVVRDILHGIALYPFCHFNAWL